MDIPDIVHTLRRRWPIVLGGLALGATASCAHLVLSTPTYDATARLYVTVASSESGSTTDLVQGGNAAEQRVRSYVDIITTPRVLQPAIDQLGLDTTAQDLADRVRASSPNETVLLNLTVNDTSAAHAAEIANAISESFTKLVADDLEQASAGSVSPVSIRTVQPAVVPQDQATPQPAKSLFLGIGAGSRSVCSVPCSASCSTRGSAAVPRSRPSPTGRCSGPSPSRRTCSGLRSSSRATVEVPSPRRSVRCARTCGSSGRARPDACS